MEETKNLIKEITKNLLAPFGFNSEIFTIEEKDSTLFVNLKDEEDVGYLIGYHGKTLDSLEFLLNLLLYYKTGDWSQVVINIGDYREKKEEYLHQAADKAIEKALYLLEPIPLNPMNAKERRLVHMYIKERDDVYSESEGEGSERRVIVFPQREEETKEVEITEE